MSEWIKCSDRLPRCDTRNLVFVVHRRDHWEEIHIDENHKTSVRKDHTWTEYQVRYFEDAEYWTDEGITHWMPLPEPPSYAGQELPKDTDGK
jgi:hypothetical protein